MDRRKNNGGPRPGAGRKPKADELELIEKLTPLQEKAFEALEKGIERGDFPFVRLYFEYVYGKPTQMLDISNTNDTTLPPPQIVVYAGGPPLAGSESEVDTNKI